MTEDRLAVYLDVENLVHPFRESGGWASAIQMTANLLGRLRALGTVVTALGVCDQDVWGHMAFSLAEHGVRVFTHGGGPDAADLSLVQRMRTDLPASVGLW